VRSESGGEFDFNEKEVVKVDVSITNNDKSDLGPLRTGGRLLNEKTLNTDKEDQSLRFPGKWREQERITTKHGTLNLRNFDVKYRIRDFLKKLYKRIFCCKEDAEVDAKLKLYEIAKQKMEQDLDILNILQTIYEVNKLKLVLLDQDQLNLFNTLSKPEVSLNPPSHINREGRRWVQKKKDIFEADKMNLNKDELITSYERVKASRNPVDIRLLDILNDYCKEHFELYSRSGRRRGVAGRGSEGGGTLISNVRRWQSNALNHPTGNRGDTAI
jgi:hypothetical protein